MNSCGRCCQSPCRLALTTRLGLLGDQSPPSLKDLFRAGEANSAPETILNQAFELIQLDGSSEHGSQGNASTPVPQTPDQAQALLLGLLRDTIPKLQGFRMSIKMLTPSEKAQLGGWLNLADSKFPKPSSDSPALRDLYFPTTLKK